MVIVWPISGSGSGQRIPAPRTPDPATVPQSIGAASGHLFGDIARPAFCCVEGDDANRVAVLVLRQILNERFEIGMSDVSLPPGLSDAATEVIEDKINVLIIAWRHDRGGLFGSTHDATRCHELDSKLRAANSCGKAFQLFHRLSPHRVSIQSVSFARRRDPTI